MIVCVHAFVIVGAQGKGGGLVKNVYYDPITDAHTAYSTELPLRCSRIIQQAFRVLRPEHEDGSDSVLEQGECVTGGRRKK